MINQDETTFTQDAPQVMPESAWHALRETDIGKIRTMVTANLDRHARKEAHPVMDFLFEYYSFSPARLMRWSPGYGVVLQGADAERLLAYPAFSRVSGGVALHPETFPWNRAAGARWVIKLLEATRDRPPRFGCRGLHEWAMVLEEQDIRHLRFPLRMPHADLVEFVKAQTLCCSHYDAFRFFSKSARPLNGLQPRSDTRLELEQAGCLHANMDLYKWAYKFYPWISSGLIIECFQLAVKARELDMRASPYDLSDLGYAPICIETEAGARAYREAQEQIYRESLPLRERLCRVYRGMLDWAGSGVDREDQYH